ncbi:hypothetical protein L484_002079 [Morus notabilis]|uniref:Pentatricopeptide repeat-containing protein n=1 Tax=Morus notabilis TaxID=981085 RepID=W9R1M8_9ROSA|nr:hypothetical protein L484_002079 [Morus notabilis]
MSQATASIQSWNWKRFISLAQRCANMRQLKPIHALFITTGLHLNNYAISKLIAFCALSDSGDLRHASLMFNQIQTPNSFIYNTLIRAYSRSSQPHLALRYFQPTVKDKVADNLTFSFVLLACVNGGLVLEGTQVHCYGGCKESVRGHRDLFQWNALMDGYIRCSLASEALGVFRDMLKFGVELDECCAVTALTACAQSGALWWGKWIHEYIEKREGFESDVFVGTALVDMYTKCGCLDMAVEVFEKMPTRNAFSWAAIIGGFAVHGQVMEAIRCLERMQADDGLKPDGVVLLGVLTACTHAGLQKEGQLLLHNMESQYGILPKHEHYSCVVDLLCRAGKLREAYQLIRRMPMKPLASVWGALLSGCRIRNYVDLAELAVKELVLLENEDKRGQDGVYVQLSNIYLAAQRTEDAVLIRKMIGDKGIRKTPGCSTVEVDGRVNEFVSGDIVHSCQAKICVMLYLLSSNSIHDPCAEYAETYEYLLHNNS